MSCASRHRSTSPKPTWTSSRAGWMQASQKSRPHAPWPTLRLMDERAFYKESQTTKPITLNCPMCRSAESYDLRWLVRTKVDRLPGNADERDRAKFKKAASYMVLLDDKVMCKNMRCRKRFDVSGVKTTAFI